MPTVTGSNLITGQPGTVVVSPDGSSISAEESSYYEIDSTYEYYGLARPGTPQASLAWKVFRVRITPADGQPLKQYANGSAAYNNSAVNMKSIVSWS